MSWLPDQLHPPTPVVNDWLKPRLVVTWTFAGLPFGFTDTEKLTTVLLFDVFSTRSRIGPYVVTPADTALLHGLPA